MKRAGKRKPKNTFLIFTICIFMLASLLYFAASVFCRTYANFLTVQKQEIEEKIVSIQMANEETQNEVDELASRQRVTAMAGNNLTYQGQNIETAQDK